MNWYYNSQFMTRFASKEVLYHGTSFERLPAILSQGLIPNPKQRVWEEDPDASSSRISRKSFEGIYLTSNFMTAKSSATTAGNGHRGVIVAVQAETRTLAVDEDKLVFPLQSFLNGIHGNYVMNEWLLMQTFIRFKKGEMDNEFRTTAEKFLEQSLEGVPEPRKTKIRNISLDLVKTLLEALLVRNMAFVLKEYKSWGENGTYEISRLQYELERAGLTLNDIPDVNDAVERFRYLLEMTTRKLSAIAEDIDVFNYTVRSLTPITYRGTNRILAVMSYSIPKDYKVPTKLNFHYVYDASAAKQLVKEFESHITSNVEITGL